ncbi:MAG: cation:proton antiporter subunit C [Vicinamibacterales bacterium]|nr:NADH-quinone oxidoreductase subunit J [Acidobacteriota bacterium]MDP7470872.1 cation:proton antiporter subunit C [Vicinamibacterales bacterium]MDP7670960.1 cation:proton antiporter subunit C [Vicinamibacterales bacterium]HJO39704.1 cation:proton antiporter subunit C [Vicinamibacterales bacterium]
MMPEFLDASTVQYLQAAALLLIGLYGIVARSHLLRKLMAMNILQVAVIVFFIALSTKSGATVPVVPADAVDIDPAAYVNPLPHALMLTAIVVSVSTTGVALALLIRIRRRYGTLNESALLDRLRE